MLTKTKEKKDKVNELLQRKKKTSFLASSFAKIVLSLIRISLLHVLSPFFSGEIFFLGCSSEEKETVH